MSLYIPDVILPPDGSFAFDLVLSISCDGTVRNPWGDLITDSKAIEVPEHGRLVDADVLLAENNLGTDCLTCKRDVRSCQYEMIHSTMDFCEWIYDAPTIIPADKEDTDG